MIATASADDYRHTLATVAGSGEFDAILAIFVPPLVTEASDVAVAIREVASTIDGCPLAAVFMTAEGPPPELALANTTVPGYQFPEEAAQAIALAARYGRWRSRPEGTTLTPNPQAVELGAAIISRELAGGGWMSQPAVLELLECYGIPRVPARFAADCDGAVDAAGELGMPVALKGVAPGLLHKRDVGAVAVGLATAEDVRRAADEIRDSVIKAGYEFESLHVQAMIEGGVELLVGVVQDESFGPVLACGAGGTNVELVRDVAVRITPVTDLDAVEMLQSLKLFPLLTGFRRSRACDIAAVHDVILRISAMVEAHPEIVELDCNPVIARPEGAVVVDARVRLHDSDPAPPVPSVGR
jgi:acyl-CoA synthetase (NDP forming)